MPFWLWKSRRKNLVKNPGINRLFCSLKYDNLYLKILRGNICPPLESNMDSPIIPNYYTTIDMTMFIYNQGIKKNRFFSYLKVISYSIA